MDLKPKRAVKFDLHVDGSIVTVSLTGQLTFDSDFDSLRDTIDRLLDLGYRELVLDLRNIFIDSAGLGEIVRLSLIVEGRGGRLKIDGIIDRIRDTFKIAGLDRLWRADHRPSPRGLLDQFQPNPMALAFWALSLIALVLVLMAILRSSHVY